MINHQARWHISLFILQVGKKLAEFTAHQAVLASVSPHFMAMFEQDPRTEVRKPYKVKETTPEAFQILLDYAYTGKYVPSRAILSS